MNFRATIEFEAQANQGRLLMKLNHASAVERSQESGQGYMKECAGQPANHRLERQATTLYG